MPKIRTTFVISQRTKGDLARIAKELGLNLGETIQVLCDLHLERIDPKDLRIEQVQSVAEILTTAQQKVMALLREGK